MSEDIITKRTLVEVLKSQIAGQLNVLQELLGTQHSDYARIDDMLLELSLLGD